MTKFRRECCSIIEDAGLTVLGIENRGKHFAVLVDVGGNSKRIFCSTTPSDVRSSLNIRAFARRLVRNI